MSLIGFEAADETDYDGYEDDGEARGPAAPRGVPSRRKRIVGLRPGQQSRLVVVEVATFDDVVEVAANLRAEKPVIVNVARVDRDTARRVLDFVAGAVYVLDGAIQKVGESIFLAAPYNTQITGPGAQEGEAKRRPADGRVGSWVEGL